MKSLLIIALLSLVASKTFEDHAIEIFSCLIRNENVKEQVVNVFKACKTKDLEIIFSAVTTAFFSIKDDVMECLEFEPILTNKWLNKICGKKYKLCINNCPIDLLGNCPRNCFESFCFKKSNK